MKKLYLTILIGVLLIGITFAGILTSIDKEVDSDTKDLLDDAGLTDMKVIIDKFDSYWKVTCFKERVINTDTQIKTSYENCKEYEEEWEEYDEFTNTTTYHTSMECKIWETITYSEQEMNEKISNFEDECIKRVADRQRIKNDKETIKSKEEKEVIIKIKK